MNAEVMLILIPTKASSISIVSNPQWALKKYFDEYKVFV